MDTASSNHHSPSPLLRPWLPSFSLYALPTKALTPAPIPHPMPSCWGDKQQCHHHLGGHRDQCPCHLCTWVTSHSEETEPAGQVREVPFVLEWKAKGGHAQHWAVMDVVTAGIQEGEQRGKAWEDGCLFPKATRRKQRQGVQGKEVGRQVTGHGEQL